MLSNDYLINFDTKGIKALIYLKNTETVLCFSSLATLQIGKYVEERGILDLDFSRIFPLIVLKNSSLII
jgi:hypothetical protein